MKVSRHNGRSGKHGSYNPKHNDRKFDAKNSEHINQAKMRKNIYWDCYVGYHDEAESVKNIPSFEEVELRYYKENYSEFVLAQNARNEINRHTERNRTIEEIYHNKKTCPEESIYQIGNIDGSVSAQTLMNITAEFLSRFYDKYSEHVHVIDFALHMDEKTPHIHERHVFDAVNNYGEKAPMQDKALEQLGIELPEPDKPKSRTNNRKRVFDARVRNMFLDICEEYGVSVEREPSYGGRAYMEKQDFIIKNQQIRLDKINKQIDDRLDGMNAMDQVFEQMAMAAYEESCSLIIGNAVDMTADAAVNNAANFSADDYLEKECYSMFERSIVRTTVENIIDAIKDRTFAIKEWVKGILDDDKKRENVNSVKESMLGRLDELASGKGLKRLENSESANIESENKESVKNESQKQVNEKVQEIAEEMVTRRRRGR